MARHRHDGSGEVLAGVVAVVGFIFANILLISIFLGEFQ
jgi:hypothetical protein